MSLPQGARCPLQITLTLGAPSANSPLKAVARFDPFAKQSAKQSSQVRIPSSEQFSKFPKSSSSDKSSLSCSDKMSGS